MRFKINFWMNHCTRKPPKLPGSAAGFCPVSPVPGLPAVSILKTCKQFSGSRFGTDALPVRDNGGPQATWHPTDGCLVIVTGR